MNLANYFQDTHRIAETLASLEARRAAAGAGGDGPLVAVLGEIIAELRAGNIRLGGATLPRRSRS